MTKTCEVSVNRGERNWYRPQPCGRKIKDESDTICGMHRNAKNRQASKEAKWNQSSRNSDANQRRANDACDTLTFEFQISAYAHYQSGQKIGDSGYTGKIVVDPADLLRVLLPNKIVAAAREHRQSHITDVDLDNGTN